MVPHGPVRVQSGDTLRSEMPYPPMAGPSAISRMDPISFDKKPHADCRETSGDGCQRSIPSPIRWGPIPATPCHGGSQCDCLRGPISFERNPMQTVPKCRETVVSGPYRVRFGGIPSCHTLPRRIPMLFATWTPSTSMQTLEGCRKASGGGRPRSRMSPFWWCPAPRDATPAPRPTRASRRTSKANSIKESGELFSSFHRGSVQFPKLAKSSEMLCTRSDMLGMNVEYI